MGLGRNLARILSGMHTRIALTLRIHGPGTMCADIRQHDECPVRLQLAVHALCLARAAEELHFTGMPCLQRGRASEQLAATCAVADGSGPAPGCCHRALE